MEDMVIESLKSLYFRKKVFVTGHTGFKGSWLIKLLSMIGADIKGYALSPNNSYDLYNLIEGDSICTSIISDIREKSTLEDAILEFQPDFIFHLAAQPLVRYSYEFPLDTFEVNVNGTANLLNAVRKLQKKCDVVLITTDKVYHNNEWVYPYRENDRLGGFDPYSSSKACCELLIDSFRNSFFHIADFNQHKKGLAVARAGNVIGGGDWSKDRLVPDIVNAIQNNRKVVLRNPNSIRPWQFVLEPLIGYLILGSKLSTNPLNFSSAYNFGPNPNDFLSVQSMVQKAIDVYGEGDYSIDPINMHPHEAGLLKLDISKAQVELNWNPKYNSEKAIKVTVEWYKEAQKNKSKIREFTEMQILNYLNEE
jgi:CDP-glucose 4,6-dehydratase